MAIMEKEKYLSIGIKGNSMDRPLSRVEVKKIEKRLNDHSRMICKILNAGEDHGHHSRITNSKLMNSEVTASKYFMHKDHKKEGGYRPVVSGCTSNTLGLSNLLSDIVESLCHP